MENEIQTLKNMVLVYGVSMIQAETPFTTKTLRDCINALLATNLFKRINEVDGEQVAREVEAEQGVSMLRGVKL